MRRLTTLAAALTLWLAADVAVAQTIQHLDLVRGLRQQGMADFAMEYLDKLKEMKIPELEAILPLEYARTRLDLAADEPEEARRVLLLTQARAEFDAFLQKNPNHPQAATANLDLARLVSLQGKNQLVKARRADDKAEEEREKLVARGLFDQSAKRYEAAAKLLDDKIKALDESKDKLLKRELEQARLRATLDRGVNLYNKAQTYSADDAKEVQIRGAELKNAIKVFESLLVEPEKSAVVWQAQAWLAQCRVENGDSGAAESDFQAILKDRSPGAGTAARLARAFRVEHAFNGVGPGFDPKATVSRFAQAIKQADAWVKDYSNAKNTPEGLRVRFIEARALQFEAESLFKRDKNNKIVGIGGPADAMLRAAERIYRELADTDNEYTERAMRSRMGIILVRSDTASKGDPQPKDMRTFDEAYLQGMVQRAKIDQFIAKLADQKVEDRKKAIRDESNKRYRLAVDFLKRAIELVDKTKPAPQAREVFEAKVLLAYCYPYLAQAEKDAQREADAEAEREAERAANETDATKAEEAKKKAAAAREKAAAAGTKSAELYTAAAELAESLMRDGIKFKSRYAAQMGALAINDNVVMLNRVRQKETSDTKEEKLNQQQAAALTNQIKDLTKFMEKTWPADTGTDSARHTLGYLLRYERDFEEAAKVYARIGPAYSGLAQARLEQGAAVFALVRNTEETNTQRVNEHVAAQIKKHAALWRQTIAALEGVPPPVPASDADDVRAYFNAKSQLGQLYLLENKFDNLVSIGKAAAALVDKLEKLTDKEKLEAKGSAKALEYSGLNNKAYLELKAGNYAAAATLLEPAIKEIQSEGAAPEDPPASYQRLRRTQRDVLVTALRGSVQDGKIARAKELLEVLQKTDSSLDGNMQLLRGLVATMRQQLDDLRKQNKTAEAKKLTDGFGEFLDTIGKQEKLGKEMLLFLGQGYEGIGKTKEAVQLFEKALAGGTKPKTDPKTGNAVKAEEQPALKFYQTAQFLLAKAYRRNKDFKKAEETLAAIRGTAKDPGWGYKSMEVRKEGIYLLEDQNNFQKAVPAWTALAKPYADNLKPLPAADMPEEQRREIIRQRNWYFDLFYEAQRCSARAYFQLDASKYAKIKDEGFDKIATRLVDLEQKNPDLEGDVLEKLRDMLDDYKPLQAKYKAKGGKKFLSRTPSGGSGS